MEFAVLFSIIADESETASSTRNVRLMVSFAPAMVESAPVEEIDTSVSYTHLRAHET